MSAFLPAMLRKLTAAAAVGLLLLSVTAVHAAPETVTFSALCFTPGATAEPTFYAANGDNREELKIPITSLGGPFKATAREGGMLDFFLQAKDEKPAFSVKLPDGTRERLLVVFVPADKGYRASALTLPDQGFTGGTTFAVNLSPMEVSIRHGKADTQSIKPGGHDLLTVPSGLKDAMVPVQIFTRNSAGAWEVAQSTRWPADKRFRSYLFLFQSPQTGILGVHAVPERLGGN